MVNLSSISGCGVIIQHYSLHIAPVMVNFSSLGCSYVFIGEHVSLLSLRLPIYHHCILPLPGFTNIMVFRNSIQPVSSVFLEKTRRVFRWWIWIGESMWSNCLLIRATYWFQSSPRLWLSQGEEGSEVLRLLQPHQAVSGVSLVRRTLGTDLISMTT